METRTNQSMFETMQNARLKKYIKYGAHAPHPQWPNGAKIALNIVINYEEGSEFNILDGDECSENWLTEIANMTSRKGQRSYFSESNFAFGAGEGIWRLLDMVDEFEIPVSIFATGQALERNSGLCERLIKSDHELVGHGYRWIDYGNMSKEEERLHIQKTINVIKDCTGKNPIGWYTGRHSENTRALIVEEGLSYDSDDYSGHLPYWEVVNKKPHLIIPYTFVINDARFCISNGFKTGQDFYNELRSSFNCLYREGAKTPKMMTIALHGRISGQPSRAESFYQFIKEIKENHPDVWFCRRSDVANHWIEKFSFDINQLKTEKLKVHINGNDSGFSSCKDYRP